MAHARYFIAVVYAREKICMCVCVCGPTKAQTMLEVKSETTNSTKKR